MIQAPTPQQYALVAQLLQQQTGQPEQVPQGFVLPRPAGQFPISEGEQPGFVRQAPAPVDPGMANNPHVDGGYNWGTRSFMPHGGHPIGIPDQPGPFLQHAKALTAATRSGLHSHQQALIQKFMAAAQANVQKFLATAQANAAKGVRK